MTADSASSTRNRPVPLKATGNTSLLRRRMTCLTAAAAAVLALALPGSASAIQGSGVAVSPFATGFTSDATGIGPVGLAFDRSNRLFVAASDDRLYRFDGPGAADAAHRVGGSPLAGRPRGLAFDNTGAFYAAFKGAGEVVQLDPGSGAVLRVVASGLGCPLGLAADPNSGDLYASEPCGHRVVRIQAPTSPAPAATTFASGFNDIDGITVGLDGTIYTVDTGNIIAIAGPAAPGAGQQRVIAKVPVADGIALGQDASNKLAFLLVNRNDGTITRVGLGTNPPTYTDVVNGGSRGDFAAVGFDGCMYATQTDSVIKVTNTDGSCSRGALGGLAPSTAATQSESLGLPSNSSCVDRRRFRFKLHHAKGTPVVAVDVFVNGRLRLHRRGASIATVIIKALPQKLFAVRILAVQKSGSALISTRTYRGCTKSRPHTKSRGHRRHG